MSQHQNLFSLLKSVGITPNSESSLDVINSFQDHFKEDAVIMIKNGKIVVSLGEHQLKLDPTLERVEVQYRNEPVKIVRCEVNTFALEVITERLLPIESIIAAITFHTLEDHA